MFWHAPLLILIMTCAIYQSNILISFIRSALQYVYIVWFLSMCTKLRQWPTLLDYLNFNYDYDWEIFLFYRLKGECIVPTAHKLIEELTLSLVRKNKKLITNFSIQLPFHQLHSINISKTIFWLNQSSIWLF